MDRAFEWIAAPHTPMTEAGALALDVVERQAQHLRSVDVTGVFVAGSTGEGSSLTVEERRLLAERWMEVGEGLRVLIHIGHNSVPEAMRLMRHAADIGAAAGCAAPPSWFPIASAGQLAETLAAIAGEAPELPFFYYHIPVLSGVEVKMAELLPIVREAIPNFAGVKFTHADAEDFRVCVEQHGAELEMLWGFDERIVEGLDAGACGAVGSTYNFAIPIYHRLLDAYRSGDRDRALAIQQQSVLLVETLGARGYAPSAKLVMKLLGVDCGPVRLPLQKHAGEVESALLADLERIGFFEWLAG